MPKDKTASQKTVKRQKKLTTKLFHGVVMIFIVAITVMTMFYYSLPEWVYYLTPAVRLYFAVDEINDAYGFDYFSDVLKKVEKQYDSTIEIYDNTGRFIYSSLDHDHSDLPADLSQASEVEEKYKLTYKTTDGSIDAGNRGFLIKVFDSGNIDVDFLVCYFYFSGGERIEVCMQVSQVAATAKVDFIVAFCFFAITVAICFIILIVYLRRFSKPIDNICTITRRMAKLDFSQKCPPTKLIEMTHLAENINTLSDVLDKSLGELNEKNEKLLKDIENERTIDNLRQTFVSGISHELKTPIAIIQGYAEGAKMFFESGNTETACEYCDIIANESVRMNNMVMRLLEITKYDSGAYEPQRENFNLRELADDWITRNSTLLSEKGITAVNVTEPEFVGNGDRIILASVINNYLSNAVSHADGAKKIVVSAEDLGENYRMYVFNTGNNIEEKHIDKIWTSFYRADKALSRSQGRFGLGLAIVASVQRLHGEKYGVNNKEDGVEFWFDIKKADCADTVGLSTLDSPDKSAETKQSVN